MLVFYIYAIDEIAHYHFKFRLFTINLWTYLKLEEQFSHLLSFVILQNSRVLVRYRNAQATADLKFKMGLYLSIYQDIFTNSAIDHSRCDCLKLACRLWLNNVFVHFGNLYDNLLPFLFIVPLTPCPCSQDIFIVISNRKSLNKI